MLIFFFFFLGWCMQADCGWSHPLKLLVRKGLSVSDVGELGRIVIPKARLVL